METNKFSGFIQNVFDQDDKYSFYYDGQALNMNLLSSKRVFGGLEKRVDYLKASFNGGGTIGLYNNICRHDLFEKTAQIFPAMIFMSRYSNRSNELFDRLLFKGNIVNQLFPPSRKIEYNSAEDFSEEFDGSKTIKLKKFSDTDVSFSTMINGEKVDCIWGVYWPGSIGKNDDNLGELTSYFAISFEKSHDIKDIPTFYKQVCQLFYFLTKRQGIFFDEIEVAINGDDKKFETVGSFVDNTRKPNDIKLKYDINMFLPNIGNLFSIICNSGFNLSFIAKDNIEAKYITHESYIKVCGALEYNYEKKFPMPIKKDQYKRDCISFIESKLSEKIKAENKNNDYKKYCKHIIELLNNDLNSTETQYNRCLKQYESAIFDLRTKLFSRYKLSSVNLGKEFSDFRNKDAHGNIIEFSNESACAFIVGLSLIDCMILDEAGFDLDTIKTIINNQY